MSRIRLVSVIAILMLGLTSCGSGGGSSSSTVIEEQPPENFGVLRPAASDDELAASLREGLSGAAFARSPEEIFVPEDTLTGTPAAEGGDAADFSTTNLQEAGVDEADTVKYDGEILYVLDRSIIYPLDSGPADAEGVSMPPEEIRSLIHLYRTDPESPSVEEVSQIELPEEDFSGGLYLHETADNRQLIGVGQEHETFYWALMAVDYFWQGRSTRVTAWDVNDPVNPGQNWTIELEGSLLTSRRIDDILYLVTRHTPEIDGLLPYPATEEEVAANEALIDEALLADLLPDLVRDGGAPGELLEGTDCYVPNPDYEGEVLPPASGSLITITAINLNAPDQLSAICLNSFASGFYASRNNLYLTANGSENTTLVHKIRLTGGQPEYRGSGEVTGYIGTGNPAFLMSESGSDLRVISSTWEDSFFPLPVVELEQPDSEADAEEEQDFGRHRLTVLRESADGTRLDTLAQLPNAERPEHLGKPGEDIYAARFFGDRAYVVTFQVIDPFYVLDLSTPEDPRISGELELPGFSTLLQPLGGDLVLGVGSEVPADGLAVTQGVKVSLFNVADVDNPVELGTEIIGRRGSYSEAMNDHHALTLLETATGYRAAMPVQRHDYLRPGDDDSDPWTYYDWSDSGLYQFEIDTASGNLSRAGALITEQRSDEQQWPMYSIYGSRSVLHDEAVFFVQPPRVWSDFWGE